MLVGAPLAALGVNAYLSKKKPPPPEPSEDERQSIRQALIETSGRGVRPNPEAFSENRRAPRLPCCLPVDLTTAFINLKAVITEVGLTGVQLRVDRLLGPDTVVQIAPRDRVGSHLTVRINRGRKKGNLFALGAEFEPGADKVEWLVDLLVLAGAGRHLGQERRRSRRLPSGLKVHLQDTDGADFDAHLIDISMRGAAVRLDQPADLGAEVRLKLPKIKDGDGLVLGSRVVGRHDRDPLYHLEFLGMNAKLNERLTAYLKKLDQAAR